VWSAILQLGFLFLLYLSAQSVYMMLLKSTKYHFCCPSDTSTRGQDAKN